MRPPLRVEAKVAEELRNWLTSELEQLDASNTNPFAHHVVTILLREDLEIDDEPLTANDRFDQWGIQTVKSIQTKDKQVKAAVQFLRSAIESDSIQESEIELIVNELVLRIEATKRRLNHRKSRGRDLLGALTTNSDSPVQKSVGPEIKEERSYNEVFPSLPGDSPLSKPPSALNVNPNNSVWNRSPPGKENSHQVRYKRLPQSSVRKVRFAERAEAEAYCIAAHVFVLTLSEICLPEPEAMEVQVSTSSSTVRDSCWKSAFYALKPTVLFCPQADCSLSSGVSPRTAQPRIKPIFVLQADKCDSCLANDTRNLSNLLDHEAQKVFLPVENLFSRHKLASYLHDDDPMDSFDLEVMEIISSIKPEEMKRRTAYRSEPCESDNPSGRTNEIQGALAFPSHHRSYFDDVPIYYPECNMVAPFAEAGVHHQSRAEESEGVRDNALGAIGSAVPGRDSDYYPFFPGALSGVSFCSDVVDFAECQLACSEDKDQASGASNPSVADTEKKNPAPQAPEECGAVGLPPREYSRTLMASGDSGVSHGAAERISTSPSSEPPLSVPPAFRLPLVYTPDDHRRVRRAETVHDRADAISVPYNATYWNFSGLPTVFPPPGATHDSFAWPEPPSVNQNLSAPRTSDMQLSASLVNGEASASWRSPLGESSWDEIQRDLFSMPRMMSDTASANNFSPHPSYLVTAGDSTLLSSQTSGSAIYSTSASFAASITPIPLTDRSCRWPTPPSQMISEPQGASYFPQSSASHFMPSDLSPGMGMDSSVAHSLQTAYVNSIFSRALLENASPLQIASSAFNCADLERSWLKAANERQLPAPEPQSPLGNSLIKGQTCSKWLENDCDLGNDCPYSHPRL